MKDMKELTLTAQHARYDRNGVMRVLRHVQTIPRLEDTHGNDKIDKKRTHLNEEFVNIPLGEFLHMELSDSVARYNERQKQKSRRITLEDKVFNDKRNKEPIHELVLAYGNVLDLLVDEGLDIDDSNIEIGGDEWNVRVKALREIASNLSNILPSFKFFNVTLHLDESNPHIHALFVPITDTDSNFNKSLSFNNALLSICESEELFYQTNKNGEPLASDIFKQVIDSYLKTEMMDVYNRISPIRAVRPQKRSARKALTEKEYKKVLKPFHDKFDEIRGALLDSQSMMERIQQLLKILENQVDAKLQAQIDEMLLEIEQRQLKLDTEEILFGLAEDLNLQNHSFEM